MKKNLKQQINIEQINAQYGKLPPQAVDVEEAVLGAIMLERDAIFKVAAIISTNAFYKEEHQKIFETVSELSAGNHAIDLLTVVQRLKDKQILNEVGGPGYITGLTGRVSSAAHIEQHARIISDKFFQREIIRFSGTLQNAAYQDDIDNLQMLYAVETQAIDNLMAGASGMMHIRDIIKHTTAAIEERVIKAKKGITPGVHTGFADLNSFTNGWQPSDVIVIAARPSMGKTAFAIALAKAAAQKDTPTDVFSLEMSNLKLSTRMILSNGGIDRDRLEKGTMTDGDWKAYNQSASELSKLPVYIDDTAKTNTKRIDAIVRTKARKGECGLAIVDYLQLAEYVQAGNKYGNKNREQEVAGMSRDLKLTAKAANIPMIILSQLNRGIENRENKAPKLSDLRESGAIEQDADVVIMLWRPCYYDEEASDAQGNSLKNLIFLEVVKNREGRLGTIILKHNEDLTEFYDFNTHNQQDPNAWMND